MANISFLVKIFAISLLWLLPGPISLAYGLGNSFDHDIYDIDPYAMEEAEEDEYEALVMELNALGLSFDSPEVQGMDNGDMWQYIIGAHPDRQKEMKEQQSTTGED